MTGLVDFSELRVAPGSRRGVIPDEVAHAFATALVEIEPVLSSLVETKESERAEQLDKTVIRDLQRAFRDFFKKRPSYTMLPTEKKGEGASEAVSAGIPAQEVELGDAPFTEEENATAPALFPPGPLESVAVSPQRLVVAINEEATVRAKTLDADGRAIPDGIELTWELWGQVGNLRELDDVARRAVLVAGETLSEGILSVYAKQASTKSEASAAVPVEVVEEIATSSDKGIPAAVPVEVVEEIATSSDKGIPAAVPVEVVEEIATSSDKGIPEPELVDQAGAKWRSRVLEERWQVNTGHPDYRANSSRPALKLRYLAMLFAKEIVLRSTQDPRLTEPLEQMVEVAAYADRQLTEKPPRGPRSRKKP